MTGSGPRAPGRPWTGAGRAWVLATAGVTMAGVAAVTAPAVAAGSLSGPMMALLLLIPLALAEVAGPLADSGALSARTDAAAGRLDRLEHAAPAVRRHGPTAAVIN